MTDLSALAVNPDEQRMFDEICSRMVWTPMQNVAAMLHTMHGTAPVGGSYREMMAIAYNVVAAALRSQPQPTGGDIERAFNDACDEVGCAYDNEALLEAIAELKRRAAPAVGTGEPVAWAIFTKDGNIRIWSKSANVPQAFAAEKGLVCTPLYTHQARATEAGTLDQISNKAREWAANYSQGSDGRNTFVLFAEWVESLPRATEAAAGREDARAAAIEECAKTAEQVAINAERRAAGHTQPQAKEAAYNKMEGAQEAANQIRARALTAVSNQERGDRR